MKQSLTTSRIDTLRRAARQIVRDLGFMQKGLAGTDLSPSAVHTIIEIGQGTIRNASGLGALLHLEKSSVSRLVQKLESEGLIDVSLDPADGRSRVLTLTQSGQALLADVEEFARRQLWSALDGVPTDDLAQIESGLGLLAHALGKEAAVVRRSRPQIVIKDGYQSGIIADVSGLHARYYAENYGFGVVFERKVATEIAEFMGRIDRPMNTTLSACTDDRLLGAVSIDGEDLGAGTAHLRWFIVSPLARGMGVGAQLIRAATEFADQSGALQTRLWTFQGLDAARHLYEKHGFTLTQENPGAQWGTQVIEQEFVRRRAVNPDLAR